MSTKGDNFYQFLQMVSCQQREITFLIFADGLMPTKADNFYQVLQMVSCQLRWITFTGLIKPTYIVTKFDEHCLMAIPIAYLTFGQ